MKRNRETRAGVRPNPRKTKIHRNYTVEEIAKTLAVHKNTVRAWIKAGLPTIDDNRPILIHGQDLANFIDSRRKTRKRPCRVGELYCLRCRAARQPAGSMADFLPIGTTGGNLAALCCECEGWMYQRVSVAKLERIQTIIDVTFPKALLQVSETPQRSLNGEFS